MLTALFFTQNMNRASSKLKQNVGQCSQGKVLSTHAQGERNKLALCLLLPCTQTLENPGVELFGYQFFSLCGLKALIL